MSIETEVETAATGQWWALIPLWVYLIALMSICILIQAWEIKHEKSKNATLTSAVATYVSTQKTNMQTISAYKKANKAWADAAARQQASAAPAVKQDTAFSSAQTTQSTNAGKALQVIYVNSPTARAWSIAPVDLSVSAELRANAGNSH
jgi:hypothetical protein